MVQSQSRQSWCFPWIVPSLSTPTAPFDSGKPEVWHPVKITVSKCKPLHILTYNYILLYPKKQDTWFIRNTRKATNPNSTKYMSTSLELRPVNDIVSTSGFGKNQVFQIGILRNEYNDHMGCFTGCFWGSYATYHLLGEPETTINCLQYLNTVPSTNSEFTPENRPGPPPKGNIRKRESIPTIHFQVRTVSFREGNI